MAAGSFEKTSIGWQLQQLQQRLGEWWELQLSKLNPQLPDVSLPPWEDFSRLGQILQGIALVLLIVLILWLLWRIGQRLSLYLYQRQSRSAHQLPQPKQLSVTDWMARSQTYQQQGNYYQACRCLYFAMLQQLHERGIAPHQASRTDREYLLLILQLPQPEPYEALLTIHQQLCFGYRQASPSLLRECQQAYQRILKEGLGIGD
jgi:hypothetical protein